MDYKKIKVVNGALASAKRIIEDQNLLLDGQVKDKTKELLNTNEALVKVNDELDNFIYLRFPSAASQALRQAARLELDAVLGRVLPAPALTP